jgi:hypothetical protein
MVIYHRIQNISWKKFIFFKGEIPYFFMKKNIIYLFKLDENKLWNINFKKSGFFFILFPIA